MGRVFFYIHPSLLIPDTPAATQKQSEIHKEIRSLYLAGTPLFTKEQISAASQQLKALEGKGGTIKIVGLTGEVGEFIVNTGDILTPKKGRQRIVGKPRLSFHSIQALTSFVGSNLYAPSIACCSLSIRQVSDLYENPTEEGSSKAPESDLDETETRDLFKAISAEWYSSKQCQDLVEVLESVDLPHVKQIVAFACGSIRVQPGRNRSTRRSMYQHALLLTVCKLLNYKQYNDSPYSISVWAQDPVYGSVDATVLAESGVSILENPDGFLKTDDSTVVLSFAPDAPVKQIITELSRPAAMLWNQVEEHDANESGDGTRYSDEDSPRVREMISRHYHLVDFSFDQDLFSNIALYIRRREES